LFPLLDGELLTELTRHFLEFSKSFLAPFRRSFRQFRPILGGGLHWQVLCHLVSGADTASHDAGTGNQIAKGGIDAFPGVSNAARTDSSAA
jgi:hypothetical protein